MFVFLMLVSKILLGFTVSHFLWRERRFWSLILKVFIAIPVGLGISSILFYFWLWLAFPRPVYPWLEFFLVIVFFAILVWRVGPPVPADAIAFPHDRSQMLFLFFALASVVVGVIFFVAYVALFWSFLNKSKELA